MCTCTCLLSVDLQFLLIRDAINNIIGILRCHVHYQCAGIMSEEGKVADSTPITKKARMDDDSDLTFWESVDEQWSATEMSEDTQQSETNSQARSQRVIWKRPAPPQLEQTTDSVVFQQLDIDYYVGTPIAGMPGAQKGSVPIVRMFGVTMEGNSVCAHVHGFSPYFYIAAPSESFTAQDCSVFHERLEQAMQGEARINKNPGNAVLAIELCHKSSIYGFHSNKNFLFLKITLSHPNMLAAARRLVTQVNVPGYGCRDYPSFESNIDFEVRFMVDSGVVGCNWIECPAGKYTLRAPATPTSTSTVRGHTVYDTPQLSSKCQIELDISWEEFISHPPEGEWQKVAPVRILSFDIECAGRKGVFPEPEKDPVIQIANMVVSQGQREPFIRNVFTLGQCAPIMGSDVVCFEKEEKLLQVSGLLDVMRHCCYGNLSCHL